MKDTYTETSPLRVLVGWAEGISKNDAVDLAKGFIQRRFEAVDASWFTIAPFSGGYLWEVHEGGPGKAYMPAIIDALSQDPGGIHWLPSKDRAFQVMMRDGKPFCILLSSADSKAIIASERPPLLPGGKMIRAVKKGTGVLATGGALFGTGFSFLLGSMAFFAVTASPGPSVPDFKFENLALAQWPKVADTAVTEVVTKLEFANGKWTVEKRHHEIKNLSKQAVPPSAAAAPDGSPAPQPPQSPPLPRPSDPRPVAPVNEPATAPSTNTTKGTVPKEEAGKSEPDKASGPALETGTSPGRPSEASPIKGAPPIAPGADPTPAQGGSTDKGSETQTEGRLPAPSTRGAPRIAQSPSREEATRNRKEPKPLMPSNGVQR